ncbi:protein CUSTOS [Eleutherodactylus coqui]|uniref:protein CUSTOS n=1 Tax=Eleutherodactylus coqui TaxID=57060 RepID=UPI00346295E5
MAAPRKSRLAAGDDSSSSDGEEQQRLREAAWEPAGSMEKKVRYQDNAASPVVPSLRARPDSHEHDGNELQTTPEFRTHVAKKLAAMLDSCIKEIPVSNRFNQKSTVERDSEDEGFRLLTTSVPGDSGEILPSPAVKRRMESSTSEDSEEEQRRYREAAVSGLDILRDSALQTTPAEIMGMTNNNQSKKKKKKKKAKKERELSDETETDDQNIEVKGKINGRKKKNKERGLSDVTQSNDQTIHLESEKKSKKKTASDCHNKSEIVKDDSKKEMGLSDETASDQNRNPGCGKSATKKKKKKKKKVVVGNSDEHY